MKSEKAETVELVTYGIIVLAWAAFSVSSNIFDVKEIPIISQENRIEWGVIFLASIVLILLKKVLSLKQDDRSIRMYDNFHDGIETALNSNNKISLNIFSLSSQTFLHHIVYKENLKLNEVKLIFPSDKAIELKYLNSEIKNNNQGTFPEDFIKNQIKESISQWEGLLKKGRVSKLKIKRVNIFPTEYFAIFGERTVFHGSYGFDGLADHHGISLSGTKIYTGKKSPAGNYNSTFNSLWKISYE